MRSDPRVRAVIAKAASDLRQLFERSGLSQYELAGIIGISPGGLHGVVGGQLKFDPQVGTLAMVAHAMGYEMVVSYRRRR
jgi:transcriptional regulator with XRE-family HTH domain